MSCTYFEDSCIIIIPYEIPGINKASRKLTAAFVWASYELINWYCKLTHLNTSKCCFNYNTDDSTLRKQLDRAVASDNEYIETSLGRMQVNRWSRAAAGRWPIGWKNRYAPLLAPRAYKLSPSIHPFIFRAHTHVDAPPPPRLIPLFLLALSVCRAAAALFSRRRISCSSSVLGILNFFPRSISFLADACVPEGWDNSAAINESKKK